MDGPRGEWQKWQNTAYVAKNAAKLADVIFFGELWQHGAEVAEVAEAWRNMDEP